MCALNQYFVETMPLDDTNHNLPPPNQLINNNDFVLSIRVIEEQDMSNQLKLLNTNEAYGSDHTSPTFSKIQYLTKTNY